MDRCAVLVDAGYLLGAAATLIAHNGLRSSVVPDYQAMMADIVEQAGQQTGLPVLRVLWYDAAVEARPTHEHLTLGGLPDVKVRLGVLVRHGGRTEQKGVDSFLQRDLTTLARNGAVSDIVLIGGDEDLRRGVVEAQDFGIKVHLWGVAAAAPRFNQAPTLVAEADRRWVLSEEWVRRHVALKSGALPAGFQEPALAAPSQLRPAVVASPEPTPAAESASEAATETASGTRPSEPASETRPSEPASETRPSEGTPGSGSESVDPAVPSADRARAVRVTPAVMAQFTQSPAGTVPTQVRETVLPTLAGLTTPQQEWADNEEETGAVVDPEAVGLRYGRRWAARVGGQHRRTLLAGHPVLPRNIDAELLRFAYTRGIDTWDDDTAKFAVRAAVWRAVLEVDQEARDEPTPARADRSASAGRDEPRPADPAAPAMPGRETEPPVRP